jgi:hypothetical protein
VVFDPLDGSSIVGSNFAVGSIFGVWPGAGVVGRIGRQQAAAAYAVYGPRTLLVWARPVSGELVGGKNYLLALTNPIICCLKCTLMAITWISMLSDAHCSVMRTAHHRLPTLALLFAVCRGQQW